MIERDEVVGWARTWGVPASQVVKDHLISHLVHAVSESEGFVFFGGTALNRTFVDGRRISEDIDVFLTGGEGRRGEDIIDAMTRGSRREFPELRVDDQGRLADVSTFTVSTPQATVRLQIVGPRREDLRWDVAERPVSLRYSDLPVSVDLVVPTSATFGAMKCAAYEERHTPRDLFDLGSLVDADAITNATVDALRRHRGYGPALAEYTATASPTAEEWHVELDHQAADPGEPLDVLARVRRALHHAGDA